MQKIISAPLFITLFALTVPVTVASAAQSMRDAAPEPAAALCADVITLPNNQEELDLVDVQLAIEQHLARAGLAEARIETGWRADDVIFVNIFDRDGYLRRVLEIDAALAAIVSDDYFPRPAGFVGPAMAKGAAPSYEVRLRRHMLGDGKPWAEWIGRGDTARCLDDYRYGGPRIAL